jgi:hypothetical protein
MPWHKIPHFPPSKMPINYLYATPIKVFYGGIYTKDLGYVFFQIIFFLIETFKIKTTQSKYIGLKFKKKSKKIYLASNLVILGRLLT